MIKNKENHYLAKGYWVEMEDVDERDKASYHDIPCTEDKQQT